jgi:HNH endonuclease
MSRRRRTFRPVPAWLMAVPPAAAIGGWAWLHEPFRLYGLIPVLLAGLVLGTMTPGILLSLSAMPMLLVPADMRKRYRKRRAADRWYRRGKPRKEQKSSYIPARLERAVMAADRYRCCYCGETDDLAVDHIFPWSLGGLTALWNLAVLCRYHNTVKSNFWRFRESGNSVYVPFKNSARRRLAEDILMHEKWHRWWPTRWIRAGLELAA